MNHFTTGQFKFDKARRVLSASVQHLTQGRRYLGGFPSKISVLSLHTDTILEFVCDEKAAVRNDYWDGEQMEYISYSTDVRVVIYYGE